MIQNCLITYPVVTDAYKIFRPDLAGLRGKTVQKDPTDFKKVEPMRNNIQTQVGC